ncbi:MAG: diheme cytochrome c [Nitrospirae bacterium]|nr:diheme cytochrome c [Nitrospirota bacterium]
MKTKFRIGAIIIGVILLVGQFAIGEGRDREWDELKGAKSGVAPVGLELYKNECGSCHFAYQPGLLPARSWDKLMSDLGNHFNENAELSANDTETIRKYLMENAADRSDRKHSIRITRSIGGNETPERITRVPYIIQKHHELAPRHITKNPKVKSFSNCNACHTRAEAGSFRKKEVVIPGFGAWND